MWISVPDTVRRKKVVSRNNYVHVNSFQIFGNFLSRFPKFSVKVSKIFCQGFQNFLESKSKF